MWELAARPSPGRMPIIASTADADASARDDRALSREDEDP
jgi:hypothetical protein